MKVMYQQCPACNSKEAEKLDPKIRQCAHCGCVYGCCTIRHTRRYVLDEWEPGTQDMLNNNSIPYDFWLIDLKYRIHGWFNPTTGRITQTG